MVSSALSILLITVFAFRDLGSNCVNEVQFEGIKLYIANLFFRQNSCLHQSSMMFSYSHCQFTQVSLLLTVVLRQPEHRIHFSAAPLPCPALPCWHPLGFVAGPHRTLRQATGRPSVPPPTCLQGTAPPRCTDGPTPPPPRSPTSLSSQHLQLLVTFSRSQTS